MGVQVGDMLLCVLDSSQCCFRTGEHCGFIVNSFVAVQCACVYVKLVFHMLYEWKHTPLVSIVWIDILHSTTRMCQTDPSQMFVPVLAGNADVMFSEHLPRLLPRPYSAARWVPSVGLLVGRQEGHPACKKTGCWFVGDDDLTGALHDL